MIHFLFLHPTKSILKIVYHTYKDCEDAYEQGQTTSGVYSIKPDDLPPFQVYCDMVTDGGGWTVFQRRKDGSVDFFRNWIDYVRGFGSLTGEHWLGLRKLRRVVASASHELRVDLEDFDGNTAFARYGDITIAGDTDRYRLRVSNYTGTAGDSFATQSGEKFSTKDQDYDTYSGNCAQLYKGGWWYGACHSSNLNGLYHHGAHTSYADGVNWYHWKGHRYSLKGTEMKIRRK